ncbi:hypothetical protein CG747_05410 [Streptomyces sp. CB02959]|uniref:hypothetical protein n=1 Tax=Streptomyces sp. CB02959 TaxID=2020330 RepID=UPI000C279D4E|nr:hypothetical protein [Streptomyces sp. CB02959]PJN42072.1 hypothetical protein CG747_05410 [Streptomyces sp. CB02959]
MALYGVEQGVRRAYFYNWGGARIPVVLQVEGEPPTPAAGAVDRLQQWLAGARLRGCGHGAAGGKRHGPPLSTTVARRQARCRAPYHHRPGTRVRNGERRGERHATADDDRRGRQRGDPRGRHADRGRGTGLGRDRDDHGGCTGPLCSETTNETGHPVLVAKDWCDKRHGPCKGTARKVLHKNRTTPKGHDWDTFYVNAHCTFRGLKHSWGIGFTERGGSHGKWVKVSDAEHFYIKKVSC